MRFRSEIFYSAPRLHIRSVCERRQTAFSMMSLENRLYTQRVHFSCTGYRYRLFNTEEDNLDVIQTWATIPIVATTTTVGPAIFLIMKMEAFAFTRILNIWKMWQISLCWGVLATYVATVLWFYVCYYMLFILLVINSTQLWLISIRKR